MKHQPVRIDIDYDPLVVIENKKRWDAAFAMKMADRPPVGWGAGPRLMLSRRGKTFPQFFDDPIEQLINQVENWKWVAENLPGDMINDMSITIQPQFENASNSNAFGSPIQWYEDKPPVALPCIKTVEELENYSPPPVEETLWNRMIIYYYAMKEYLEEGNFKVTLWGEPVKIDLQLHTGGESPFMIATDLCSSKVYEWMYESPEGLHRLLQIITDRLVETEKRMRKICGFPDTGRWFLADDTAQVISPKQFSDFVVPYSGKVYDELTAGPNERIMHMCGRHTHLYPALVNDLKVQGMWGYGYLNTPEEVREGLGGKMSLLGNLDPMLLCDGPKEQIIIETKRLLDVLLPCGGIIIGDGYNIIPETPLENLQLVADTVSSYNR